MTTMLTVKILFTSNSVLVSTIIMSKGEVKVHLNPKYFFRLIKSLHQFETHVAFLNLILTFLLAIKVTKPRHHLQFLRPSQ